MPVCSIEEQRLILSELDYQLYEIDIIDNRIKDQLVMAEILRQSILKKAFSGQLVQQEPNDEPASTLLARIRAEKKIEKDKF